MLPRLFPRSGIMTPPIMRKKLAAGGESMRTRVRHGFRPFQRLNFGGMPNDLE